MLMTNIVNVYRKNDRLTPKTYIKNIIKKCLLALIREAIFERVRSTAIVLKVENYCYLRNFRTLFVNYSWLGVLSDLLAFIFV